MKFNEKLIQLRKKEGLSQEELGYKLNVTRQTVSKWELGQTTPEMDKLVEISKIFSISVDELINDMGTESSASEPIIEDQPIGEKSNKEKNMVSIIVGILVIVLVLIVIRFGFAMYERKSFEKMVNDSDSVFGKAFGMFENIMNKAIETEEDILDDKKNEIVNTIEKTQNDNANIMDDLKNGMNVIEETSNQFDDFDKKFALDSFNNLFEMYSGKRMGASVISFLDKVITNNKKEERKITIKYLETETQDESQIKSIRNQIDNFDDYDVTLDYDSDGFVYKATIEKL